MAELEKKRNRRTAFDENEMHQPTAISLQTRSTVTDDSIAQSSASVSVRPNAAELDELYRLSAQVKPLEYDLTQRKIEVKALKQALKDVRRIHEKQLISVRLQAENRSGTQYKEKLAHQQKLIESLRTRLSNSLHRKSSKLKPQPQFELVQEQGLTSAEQRLAGTVENLAQSERRVADLQKEVGGLNQKLNSRSNELETLRLQLKESDHRGSLLAGRIKLLDARVQQIHTLNQSLKSARLAVAAGKANDIEVRRLRSEMQSLQSIHDDSTNKVKSLENLIREQQRRIVTNNQLKERVQELESVEADNELRDQQISELKERLRELSKNSRLKSDKPKKHEKKTKSWSLPSPLYTAPEEKDDLKKINGIGPVMEKLLNSLGITSFKQVAEFSPDDISTITDAIKAFPGRIERDNWIGGAKEHYAQKYLKVDA